MLGTKSNEPLRSSVGTRAVAPEGAWRVLRRNDSNLLPKTVIDVGVGRGTAPLYRTFPDAYHVLVEPLPDFAFYLNEILAEYRGCWVRAAASSAPGKRSLYIEDQYREMSSFFRRRGGSLDLRELEVEVVRVGDLVRDRELPGPFIIKTDVEGSDLEVLRGAHEIFPETMFVICECRADNLFGSATMDSITKYLFECGFGISNLLEVRWEPDGALRWANIVFRNEQFRFDRRESDV